MQRRDPGAVSGRTATSRSALESAQYFGTAESSTPRFGGLAGPYRYLEYLTFGNALQKTRTYFLPQLAQSRSALVLGDGDGRFTAALLQSIAEVRVHAVDASGRMLESLRRNAGIHQDRVSTECCDIRRWTPKSTADYDLVATHFFLDCLTTEDVSDLAERLKPGLIPGAIWVNSEFAVPPTLFGHLVARPLIRALYLGFRILAGLKVGRLPDYNRALGNAGWSVQSERARLRGLLTSQLWKRE